MKNVFIIHFLNQSILNYMLKYTPVKTYMNTSQGYCITKTDFYSITNLLLCFVYNFIHLVRRIHNEREISAVGGEDGRELRGKDLNHTRVSFIRRVPVRIQMHGVLHPATAHQAFIQCEWQHCKVKKRGRGMESESTGLFV